MNHQKTSEIHLIQTPKALLATGTLPGIEHIEADIQENNITLTLHTKNTEAQQTIPLPRKINTELTIITYQNNELRMVMPWRNEQ